MKKEILMFATVVSLGLSAHGQVMKCKGADGKTIYSDTLCGANSTSRAVDTRGSVIDSSYLRSEAKKNQNEALLGNLPTECTFKSYKHGDAKGKVLADNASRECVANVLARKNGQPTSKSEYQMWKDHNDDTTAKRYAPKSTLNCTNSGFGTAVCR